tara:strand:+ start:250 stop:543 length:294 start_codon:yes stop_codon:yes gene_type:complete
MLRKYGLNRVQSKDQLIKIVFDMHNEVNKRTRKPLFDYTHIIETYSKLSTKDTLDDYYIKMSNSRYGERMMLYSFKRNRFIHEYARYCKNNIENFEQ